MNTRTPFYCLLVAVAGTKLLACAASAEEPVQNRNLTGSSGKGGTASSVAGSGGGGGGGGGGSLAQGGNGPNPSGGKTSSSGGSGGSAGTGQPFPTGGSSGNPSACVKASGSSPLIDDLSDDDKNLVLGESRNGKWAVAADSAGSLAATAGSVVPAAGEYCLEASGHNEWGANLSAYLLEPRSCYDASAYKGVCFKARGKVTTASVDEMGNVTGMTDGTVVFGVTKTSTEYDSCGATCGPENAVDLSNKELDSTAYKDFCFAWSDLEAEGVGMTDASDIWRLEWRLPAWSWKGYAGSVDGFICVDDVRFQK